MITTINRRRFNTATLAGALLAGASAGPRDALAQDAATRPIRFVVPFPPGPAGDLTARYYARRLQETTGQPVVVDNKPGGNGFIGVQAALSAPADGLTVFIGSNSAMAANAALFRKLPYDPAGDFTPVHGLMRSPMVILTSPQKPYQTLADLIRAGRQPGNKISYSAGTAAYQLMVELFMSQAGMTAVHVPYKGGMEAVNGVLVGDTDFTIIDLTAPLPLIKGARLRPLAIATERRIAVLPDLPTTGEAGLDNFKVTVWVAAFVRSDTPRPMVDKLAEAIGRIANSRETRDYYAAQNAEPMLLGAAELKKFQVQELELWKRVAAAAKIEPQ